MNKIPKSYKIDPDVVRMIEEIKSQKIWTETTVIEQAVKYFYENKEDTQMKEINITQMFKRYNQKFHAVDFVEFISANVIESRDNDGYDLREVADKNNNHIAYKWVKRPFDVDLAER